MRWIIIALAILGFFAVLSDAEANHRHRVLSLHRGDTWDVTCNNSIVEISHVNASRTRGTCVAPPVTPTLTPTATVSPTPSATSTPTAVPPSPTPTGTPTVTPTPFGGQLSLHVAGNRIVNGSGQVVQLHGVNRSGHEYACVEGWGFGDGPYDASQVPAMKMWNINVVRVNLNTNCWLGINGAPPDFSGLNYQNAVAAYVSLLTQNNIAVILDIHWSASGTFLARGQEPMADRDHAPTYWTSVANRFKGNSAVLFDLFNEPHLSESSFSGDHWQCWRDGGCLVDGNMQGEGNYVVAGMQELINAIRATGASNIIVVNGENWGSDVSRWLEYRPADPLNQLVAGWHSYGDGLSCQNETCWNSVLAGVLNEVPIIATEIGQFNCQHDYIDRVMNFLDGHSGGYLAWSWGPHNCSNDPALLTNWEGGATQTYGQGFKDHLLGRP